MQNNQCGSQWRKWDLHIHTPYSIVATDYKKDIPENKIWDNFIDKLEKITEEKNIRVIGINDYWILEGYKKVKEYKESGRLENIDAILPVVEYRIDTVVDRKQKVNYHVIFEDIGYGQLYEQWICRFLTDSFKIDGLQKQLTYENILKCNKDGQSFQDIHNNLVFNYKDIIKFLHESHIVHLHGFGVSEFANMDKIAFPTVFENFKEQADFFFLASGGTTDKTISEVIAKNQVHYNDVPILHCSDTHNYPKDSASTTPKDMGHCWTWIKGEASFNGLKFALEDCKSRIKIQEESPFLDTTPPYLESICFPEKFKIKEGREVNLPPTIYFNRYMTSIIGGRGSGKTTLLEAINARVQNSSTDVDFSMKEGNLSSLRNKVLYLGKEKLHNIIDLKEYVGFNLIPIPNVLSFTAAKLQALANSTENKNNLDLAIDKSRKLIDSYQSQAMRDMLSRYNSVLNDISEHEKLLQELNIISEYANVLIEINNKISNINQNSFLKPKLSMLKFSLEDETKTSKMNLASELIKLNDLKRGCKNNLESAFPDKNIKSITDAIQLESENITKCENEKKRIESIENEFVRYSDVLDVYVSEYIKYLQESIAEHDKTWVKHKQNHLYTSLLKGVNVKSFLKFNITKMLSLLISNLDNRTYNQEKIVNELFCNFNNYLDLNQVKHDGDCILEKDSVIEIIESFFDVLSSMKLFNYILSSNVKGNEEWITKAKILNEIYSFSYISIESKILYNDKPYEVLSAGEKGVISFLLNMDIGEKDIPLLVDQPEDYLDNKFIHNELIPILKQIKEKRQVIMVSHNSNLVVNGDSELVLIAHNVAENSCKFDYLSGTLESIELSRSKNFNNQTMKEHICDIMEGGKQAFEKRAKKYRIS